ncbi:hypothetical protein A0O30_08475 [Pseudomonas sp. LLC-1]|uniref:YiiX/YebB-like N1pC/P60 family cysteine hydrolase n=1 Tax=Pseudomonas sp. LLC-1 TaxID=1812180 RepID=UPI000D0152B5|nr:YiiX/YebB-like N1pC/P60 family cysteine hydrolase [Pseudomonas sp. LLC-1]PRN05311.1 hypothetical protein A0O30_08475 [Pseudomonas sp. LLC-1]
MSARKYILESSLLQPADIILTGDKSGISLSVRVATISRYSHAAIYVGDTTIEATMAGVFSKNPQRLIFDRATDVLVLRSKRLLSKAEVELICSYAHSKVGSLYALREAITIKYKSLLKHNHSNRQFCSRLVAKAYEHANFDLMNLRNPAFCTPKQLALCKAFEPVKCIIRPASEAEIEFAESADQSQENLRQLYEWLDKTRILVTRNKELADRWDIQTLDDVTSLLMAHPEYDLQVSKYMQDSGYLEFYTSEVLQNPFRYKAELLIHQLSQVEDKNQAMYEELKKEVKAFEIYESNQKNFVKLFKEKNLNFFKLNIQLYNNMLSAMLIRTLVVRDALVHYGSLAAAEELESSVRIVESAVNEGHMALKGAN